MNIRKVSLEMSIDIRITQKGLLKKTLPLHVITGSDLCYGTSDGMKLKENFVSFESYIPRLQYRVDTGKKGLCGFAGVKPRQS